MKSKIYLLILLYVSVILISCISKIIQPSDNLFLSASPCSGVVGMQICIVADIPKMYKDSIEVLFGSLKSPIDSIVDNINSIKIYCKVPENAHSNNLVLKFNDENHISPEIFLVIY